MYASWVENDSLTPFGKFIALILVGCLLGCGSLVGEWQYDSIWEVYGSNFGGLLIRLW